MSSVSIWCHLMLSNAWYCKFQTFSGLTHWLTHWLTTLTHYSHTDSFSGSVTPFILSNTHPLSQETTRWLRYSPTPPFNYSITKPLNDSLIHLLTRSLHSFTPMVTHSNIQPLNHCFTPMLAYSTTHPLNYSTTDSIQCSPTQPLNHLLHLFTPMSSYSL